jgi:hypothetical protein
MTYGHRRAAAPPSTGTPSISRPTWQFVARDTSPAPRGWQLPEPGWTSVMGAPYMKAACREQSVFLSSADSPGDNLEQSQNERFIPMQSISIRIAELYESA